jgi:hypothetical protein
MKLSMGRVIVGTAGLALVMLAGCENNEANVQGTGVTPPTAAATSEAAGQLKAPGKGSPPGGYADGTGRYTRKAAPKPAAKSSAPAEKSEP